MPAASEVKSPVRVHIRWMIACDYPEVLAIENASFDFPGTEEQLRHILRQRDCIGMVAEVGERIVGFMIYSLKKQYVRVLCFAVHPEFRRRGVGQQMAAKLVGKLESHRRTAIELTVCETNLGGQLFWKSAGFRATSVSREHYPDTGEDGYEFAYVLEDESDAMSGLASTHRLNFTL